LYMKDRHRILAVYWYVRFTRRIYPFVIKELTYNP
jgi:hypothetical protein